MKEVQLQWSLPHPFPRKLTASTLTQIDIIIWNPLKPKYLILVSFPMLLVAWVRYWTKFCTCALFNVMASLEWNIYFSIFPISTHNLLWLNVQTNIYCVPFKPFWRLFPFSLSWIPIMSPGYIVLYVFRNPENFYPISVHLNFWSSVRNECRLSVRYTTDFIGTYHAYIWLNQMHNHIHIHYMISSAIREYPCFKMIKVSGPYIAVTVL